MPLPMFHNSNFFSHEPVWPDGEISKILFEFIQKELDISGEDLNNLSIVKCKIREFKIKKLLI